MTTGSPFIQWISSNPGKTTGAAAGFLLGILLLTIGVVKTLLIILLVIIGGIAGKLADDRVTLPGLSGKFFKGRQRDDDEEDFH